MIVGSFVYKKDNILSENTTVHEAIVDGNEIAPLVANLEMALEQCSSRDHAIVALISMALVVTYPEISPQQLAKAVQDVSRYICLILEAEASAAELPKDMKVN